MAPLALTPTIITVDRGEFVLKLWKLQVRQYKVVARYPISVGAIGYRTTPGMYFVESKSRTPDWLAPDSDWVPEEKRGKLYKFGEPENPFLGAFISLAEAAGVGIHGTKDPASMGTRASHGCIRMVEADILKLYGKVPVNTPVFIY